MPLYASLADMQARFEERDLIQLTDEAGDNVIDEAKVDRALNDADATIKGYVAARHKSVEDFAGHAELKKIACLLAFADLHRTEPPEFVTKARDQAIATLKAISAGTFKLDSGEETAAPRPGQILTSTDDRRFGRANLDSY